MDAGENKVVLKNHPTDEDEDSLAVATVGYVQTHAGLSGVVKTTGDQTIDGGKTFL